MDRGIAPDDPSSNTRGLALLTAATSWPAFQMGVPLQPQLLKLEEVFEESRRSGMEIQDTMKAAILLKCVTVENLPQHWSPRRYDLQNTP